MFYVYVSVRVKTMLREGMPHPEEERRLQRLAEWNAMRERVREMVDKLGEPVDPGIEKAVVALNIHHIRTDASCEGHTDHGIAAPWVDIAAEPKWKEKFEGESAIFQRIAEKHGIAVEDLSKPGNERALLEAMEEVSKYPLTPEFLQWAEENKQLRDRLQALLDEFYEDREVPREVRLTISPLEYFFRLHNGGNDYSLDTSNLSEEQRRDLAQRLASYQAEMDAFSEFLKKKFIERG